MAPVASQHGPQAPRGCHSTIELDPATCQHAARMAAQGKQPRHADHPVAARQPRSGGAARQAPRRSPTGITIAALTATVFIVLLAVANACGRLPLLVIVTCGCAIPATYITYAVDKRAARHGQWRVSEATLHILELLGGWPGALLAQQLYRHKTRKVSFQVAFWLCAIVNSIVLALLALPETRDSLWSDISKLIQ